MTSKQINIKQELADKLDELRETDHPVLKKSYSGAVEELLKIKEEYGKLRMGLD